jgi:hypothetical protein
MTHLELKEKLIKEGKRGLALDVDDTLAATGAYWAKKLHEKFGSEENLTLEETLEKYVLPTNVPYWMQGEPLAWMDSMVLSNEFTETLPLTENVHAMVQKINTIVPVVAYITARPEIVRDGTMRWLKKHNFPDAPLVLRSTDTPLHGASVWKSKILHELYPHVTGIIDDNINLAMALPDDYKGTLYLYNVKTCDRKNIDVVCTKTWDDVYLRIQERYKK